MTDTINTWLDTTLLDKTPGHTGSNPFDQKWAPTRSDDGVTAFDYQVYGNTRSYLSIAVHSRFRYASHESDGMTFFNFDLRRGDPFDLSDILTEPGVRQLLDSADAQFWSTLKSVLAPPDGPVSGVLPGGAPTPAALHLLATCRATLPDPRNGDVGSAAWFWLSDDTLHVDLHAAWNACVSTPRDWQLIDSLGLLQRAFPFAQIAALLNPYGRCLLIEQRTDCVNPAAYHAYRSLHGTINRRYAITVLYAKASSFYFYDKVGTPVSINVGAPDPGGWASGTSIQLSRWSTLGAVYRPTELFDLHLAPDGSLAGTWRSLNPPSVLPVSLH